MNGQVEQIKQKIGDCFNLDYSSLKPNKRIVKCSIAVQCTKCQGWQYALVGTLYQRKLHNELPYVCSACATATRMQTPEAREKCSQNTIKMWQNKEIREKLTGLAQTRAKNPTIRENISTGVRKAYQDDPTYRKKARESAKKSWSNLKSNASREFKMAELYNDPLFKEMMSANSKLNWMMPDYKMKVLGLTPPTKQLQKWTLHSRGMMILKRIPRLSKYKCNLEIGDIAEKWCDQNGRCALSNIPLTYEPHAYDSMSIDRIDSTKDYTKDNIQLVGQFINYGKSRWSDDSIKQLIEKLYINNTPSISENDIRNYYSSHYVAALKHITIDEIISLWKQQNGLCALSKIPMICTSGPDTISIDRIDSKVGYELSNIQLVCRFFNLGKRHYDNNKAIEFIELIRQNKIIVQPSLNDKLDQALNMLLCLDENIRPSNVETIFKNMLNKSTLNQHDTNIVNSLLDRLGEYL